MSINASEMDSRWRTALQRIEGKLVSAAAAVAGVAAGSRVFIGTACGLPRTLLAALETMPNPPADIEICHFLTNGVMAHDGDRALTRFRHRCFFVGSDMRHAVRAGVADYVPISLAELPRLIENGRIAIDCALIQVSPPDEFGFVSLGVSVDITLSIARHARRVIAEVNPHMPRTMGESFLHIDQIHSFVEVNEPLTEHRHEAADAVAQRVAQYIAGIIEDGSTLQIGLGRIPNEALKYLTDRRDLGIHSDVITDGVLDLVERGIVTGKRKTLHPGQVVASYCFGSQRLYQQVNGNPMFGFYPIEHVCDPDVIRLNPRMVSLTQAFALDLTGQVCVDQFQGEFYGGVSTQPDFVRGAARSPGGKPIICLPSTTDDGRVSRIRARLDPGEGVAVARSDVHYVVTEYGIAYLFGKSIRERVLALIEVAHLDFREGLLAEATRLGYVPVTQTVKNRQAYAIEDERTVSLRDGRKVMLRPTRAGDAAGVQAIFYRMSKEDVYTRFFQQRTSFSQRDAERYCNLNQESDVAYLAVAGERDNEQVVGSCCYFLNHTSNLADVSYMILPEWQGTGLGGAMQRRLREHAQGQGIRGLTADILMTNSKMLKLAKAACEKVAVDREDDSYHVTMLF